jgi:DNA-binding transcriptional MerR regulator
MDQPLMIGALARATGVTTKTIRYYEQVGVLPAPGRSEAGYRQYTKRDVHRLLFIRRARALGLSLKDLKVLTAKLDDGLCGTMRPRLLELVHLQLDTVQRQIVEFQLLQQQLDQVLRQLLTAPPSDRAEGCQCLDPDAASPGEGSQQPCTLPLGVEVMNTRQTLETFTILPTTSCEGDSGCGCGCGCDVAYLPVSSVRTPPRTRGDVPEEMTP